MLFGEVGKVYALFLHELSPSMNAQKRAAERLLQQHKVAETIKKVIWKKKLVVLPILQIVVRSCRKKSSA